MNQPAPLPRRCPRRRTGSPAPQDELTEGARSPVELLEPGAHRDRPDPRTAGDWRQFADWGIVNHVVPDGEVRARATALAHRYAAGPTRALAAGRAMIRGFTDGGLRVADAITLDHVGPVFDSADMPHGVAQFLERGMAAVGHTEFSGP